MSDASDRRDRIRILLALEIHRIVHDCETRGDFLMQVWSRYRRRQPFLETLFSRWQTVAFGDLAELDAPSITAVQRFYDELDGFRLYVAYTEDMPVTLRDQYDSLTRRLKKAAGPAMEALGGVPERMRTSYVPDLTMDMPQDHE